jgi:hypothetical protein
MTKRQSTKIVFSFQFDDDDDDSRTIEARNAKVSMEMIIPKHYIQNIIILQHPVALC